MLRRKNKDLNNRYPKSEYESFSDSYDYSENYEDYEDDDPYYTDNSYEENEYIRSKSKNYNDDGFNDSYKRGGDGYNERFERNRYEEDEEDIEQKEEIYREDIEEEIRYKPTQSFRNIERKENNLQYRERPRNRIRNNPNSYYEYEESENIVKDTPSKNTSKAKTIAIIGSEEGVGASYISLAMANLFNNLKVKVAVINYSDKEKYDYQDVKDTLNSLSIPVYKRQEISKEVEDYYEVLIKDFSYKELDTKESIDDFNESNERFFVVIPSTFKRKGFNRVLWEKEKYDFKTIINLIDEETFNAIKGQFKNELELIRFPFVSDIMVQDEVQMEEIEEFLLTQIVTEH